MNQLKRFNKTIQYIEEHLDSSIDEEKILEISTYQTAMFSRIFTILSGSSLGEYIRLRRMTRAAQELREGKQKVIDVALKYGYESVDAFTAAFKRFHDATPSAVRQGAAFRMFQPLHFSLHITGGQTMEIRIEHKQAFRVAGLVLHSVDSSKCPQLWQDLLETFGEDSLAALGNGQSYGGCFNMEKTDDFSYMAGYDVTDEAKAREMGLTVLDVPKGDYAVVKLTGPVPQCIHEGWSYVMSTFFPSSDYHHAGTPDLEVYCEGDMSAPDYTMELWIPVLKNATR